MPLVLLVWVGALVGCFYPGVAAGLLIEPRYQVDLVNGLHIKNQSYRGVSSIEGFQPLSAAIFLAGDSRQLLLPPDVLSRATRILSQGNEFTLMASLRQDERNTGTILAFSEGNNRFLELQSSGRKDELRLHYTHRGTVLVETFPYRLADGTWHQLAVSVSGNHIDVFVDCSRIYKRVIHEVDFQFEGRNLTLWLGQRNAKHFLFKGSLQDVKIIGRAHGYVMQCPHIDTECPTCGQFRQLQVSVFHLENFIQHLTDRLAQAENRLAAVEQCECQKSCKSNNTAHPHGTTWVEDCELCSCLHGDIKCRPLQCPPTKCKKPLKLNGECCPTCLKHCVVSHVVYDHGEEFSPTPCVKCICNDGGAECNRTDPKTTCPSLTCPEKDQLNVSGECCRYCPGMDYCSQGHDCHNNATCLNLHTRYACECNSGYQGTGKECTDINECLKKGGHDGHHCHINTICTNLPGTYTCECLLGYKRLDSFTCVENDECSSQEHKCDKNAICINTAGSYRCQCQRGYTGDGFNCQPFCNQTCLNGGQCVAPGLCSCRRGYTGPSCELDVNECSLGLHQCHANSDCVNMPGWYYCPCKQGYQGHVTENSMAILCQDIDECLLETHTCHNTASCINEDGGYHCECVKNETCSLDCADDGQTRVNGEVWHPDGQSCRSCSCSNGVSICTSKSCDCADSDVDITCCPQCDRSTYCHHQEAPIVFQNGDQWIFECQTCECMYGEVDCWKMECPPVSCENPVLEPGTCCPACDNDPCSSSAWSSSGNSTQPKGCVYQGKVYFSGQKVPFTQDPCTSCKCQNGGFCCSMVDGCLDGNNSFSSRHQMGRRSIDLHGEQPRRQQQQRPLQQEQWQEENNEENQTEKSAWNVSVFKELGNDTDDSLEVVLVESKVKKSVTSDFKETRLISQMEGRKVNHSKDPCVNEFGVEENSLANKKPTTTAITPEMVESTSTETSAVEIVGHAAAIDIALETPLVTRKYDTPKREFGN